MRLRDRLSAALQTFREAPDLRSRLNAAEFELKIADQALELREKECDRLREIIGEMSRQTASDETLPEASSGMTMQ